MCSQVFVGAAGNHGGAPRAHPLDLPHYVCGVFVGVPLAASVRAILAPATRIFCVCQTSDVMITAGWASKEGRLAPVCARPIDVKQLIRDIDTRCGCRFPLLRVGLFLHHATRLILIRPRLLACFVGMLAGTAATRHQEFDKLPEPPEHETTVDWLAVGWSFPTFVSGSHVLLLQVHQLGGN
eukprot:SAG31_NODE_6989_length_1826_cov_1.482339_1_plen_182_part_00